jgi:hypothetical protein
MYIYIVTQKINSQLENICNEDERDNEKIKVLFKKIF